MDELEFTLDDGDLDVPTRGGRPPGAEVIDRVGVRQRAINALEAEQLVDMLDFVDTARVEGAKYSANSASTAAQAAVHDLSLALQLPPGVITRKIATARRIRGRLPITWRYLLGGSISTWQTTVIDTQLQRLTRPDTTVALDRKIAEHAASHTPTQTRRWLARQVERLEADAARARHRRAMEDRHVRVTDAGDGMAWLNALLPAVDAHAIAQRLDTETRHRVRSETDQRSHDQAVADLFTGILLGSPDHQTSGGVKTVIGITVPITTILGLSDAPGELADRSATVPADLVRGKALEPGTLFHRLLTDPHGHLLDTTYLGRFAPEKVKTALWFRDGTTTFPTSTIPADKCDADLRLRRHARSHPGKHGAAKPPAGPRRAPASRGVSARNERGPGNTYRRDPEPLPIEPLPIELWPEDLTLLR